MKYRLLAPGPTPVPDRVLKEMNKSIIHHRTEAFQKIFAESQENLKWLLGTSTAPLILSSSGTGAFESAVQNFFSVGDTVLCVGGGKFAEKWHKMCNVFGLKSVFLPLELGHAIKLEDFRQAQSTHKNIKGVIVVASETSTGVRQPYEEIAELVKSMPDCLMLVDAVTALGVWDINPEEQHIDLLVSGSQKGLMLPPGLGFTWVSEKAWARQAKSNLPRYYFDLARERKAQIKNETAFTPAVSLIMGLHEALTMMREEGKSAIFKRHERLGQACRAGMQGIGLKLFAERPSDAVTSVHNPKEVADDAVYKGLMKLANFTIAGGQDELKGKIFRIGHMGYVDEIDLIALFGALEIVLRKAGYEKFTLGDSFRAAMPILQKAF
jgi:aspartate aminotransferase-like enzyme